jgi:ankyrin repeat protein
VPSSKLRIPLAVEPLATGASAGEDLLWVQALNGDIDRVIELLDGSFGENNYIDKPNRAGSTPLLLAAERGHDNVVAMLIARGASIASKDRFAQLSLPLKCLPLTARVVHCFDLFVFISLNRQPLYVAATNGHVEVVKQLLEAGADPMSPGPPFRGAADTALAAAMRNKHAKVVSALSGTLLGIV